MANIMDDVIAYTEEGHQKALIDGGSVKHLRRIV
jgi:hypothetical protein